MASTKIVLRTDKKKNGQCPVYLRIYHNGKKVYKSLGISLAPKYWDEEHHRVKGSHDHAEELNIAIGGIKGRADVAVASVQPLTAQNVKRHLEGKSDLSFYEYAESILGSYKHSYRAGLDALLSVMKEYKRSLMFSDITPSFLRSFERWLMSSGRSQNTATEYLKRIGVVLNRAMRDDLIEPNDNPFAAGKVRLKREPTDPTPLDLKQFSRLRDAALPGGKDKHGITLATYRDLFLFATYNDGMRLADTLTLKESCINGDRLKYVMGKTGKTKALTMVPAAVEIAEKYQSGSRYLFPIIPGRFKRKKIKENMSSYRNRVWRRIKRIGKLAGLEVHLHFHMSRNTSAFIAYKSGASIVAIQDMLGHSSVQQTRDYLGKMDPDDFTEMRNEMWK